MTTTTTANVIKTGKKTDNGLELAISHYAKGVWKVLALRADGSTEWFIPTSSKKAAFVAVDWHGR